VADPQLEDLLDADDALAAGDGGPERVQQRGLASLGSSGHDDVEADGDAGFEELRGRWRQGAEFDQVGEPRRLRDELADVDGAEPARDAVEDDVEPMPGRQHRVDEGRGDVDAPVGRLQHPLDQVADGVGGEDGGGQLVAAVAGDEDAIRLVDPDLLDGRIVEVALQRPEPSDPGDELVDDVIWVVDRQDGTGQAALVVVADGGCGHPADGVDVMLRVDAALADLGADVGVERLDVRRRRRDCGHRSSLSRRSSRS
jgi:hypothetical protein